MDKKEIKIATTDELKNGEMKTIYPDEGPEILLIRKNDKYFALEAYCPHYGAPLETGIIAGKKIMCPWHHALFDVETGAAEEPPALDGLKKYQTEVRGKDIILTIDDNKQSSENAHVQRDKEKTKDNTFVIIGGGASAHAAVRFLRENGFDGKLQMVSADSEIPYDRTALSKNFIKNDLDSTSLLLNNSDYYQHNQIELNLNQKVTGVNADEKKIFLDNKNEMSFDKLLVASGGKPKKLQVNGSDLGNICTLRSLKDAEIIKQKAKNSEKIAVIGAGFIGMEMAQNLNNENNEIHVVAPETVPFETMIGKQFGKIILDKLQNNGIHFHLGNSVSEFKGESDLSELKLKNGEKIQADMAIIAIGIKPETDFMPHYNTAADSSLITDKYLQVENNIFAAGDIATFPYRDTGDLIRIEHWRVAEQQGRIAAANMLDMKRETEIVPFFWTNLAGMRLRYVGYAEKWDDEIVHGDLSKGRFIIYYIRDKQVHAALGADRDEHMAIIEMLLKKNKMPTAELVKKGSLSAGDLHKFLEES